MSYQERRSIVNIISSILIVTVYAAYMLQRYPDAGAYSKEIFSFWGAFFLILIPVSIVARIIITIIFSIINTIATNEGEPSIVDERDQLIELKAARNSGWIFVIGMFVAMGSLVLEMEPTVMFVILFGAGLMTDIVSELYQFYFYRRGV